MNPSKKFDEAAILRFEPNPDKKPLSDLPQKRSIDFAFIKDIVQEYLQGLDRVNRSLNDTNITTAFKQLEMAYSSVFGSPLLDTQNITEGYQDRVQAVADAVYRTFEDKTPSKSELLQAIELQAKWTQVTEYKLSQNNPKSTAWRDFQKDVLAMLKGKIKLGRPGAKVAAADRKQQQKVLLDKISRIIEDSIGYSFPDGDPTDYIYPRVVRLGIDSYEVGKWLDLAAKTLGSRSFHDYMSEVYDNIMTDNPEAALQSGLLSNPWNNKPLDISSIIPQTMDYNPRLVVDALLDADVAKNPQVIDELSNYKQQLLKTLLKIIKENPNTRYAADVIRNLQAGGLHWPEFDTILQSVGNNKLWEQMQPGDIFTLHFGNQTISGTIVSKENTSIIVEGDVIYNKFATKQAQKGVDKYKHNTDIAAMIPMYNPVKKSNAPAGHFTGVEEPYDHFEVQQVRNNIAHIMGVTKDGERVQTSSTTVELATALVDAFNRKGFTDLDIQRVPLGSDSLSEAEYQGRQVTLNKPMPGDVKKYRVYVKDPKTGNIKKVNFGDKQLSIKRDDPKRKRSFRARHKCDQKKDRTTPGYWSCKLWGNKKVSDILKGK